MGMWTPKLNAVLAALVATVGFWIVLGEMSAVYAAGLALLLALGLAACCSTIPSVWAWATLLLGVESLSWPIMTMWRLRGLGSQPSDEAMSQILTAIVGGLFSSIFWLTFAIGIFRWNRAKQAPQSTESPANSSSRGRSSSRT